MNDAQRHSLTEFLESIAEIKWLARCGEPQPGAIVATDLCNAWDGWGRHMTAIWSQATHSLECVAIDDLGTAIVDEIFASVSEETDESLRLAMERYFERRPLNSEVAEMNADRGLWPEWLDSIRRDLCWAAVENIMGRSGFFLGLLKYYRDGRWPCAWEDGDNSKRVVLL